MILLMRHLTNYRGLGRWLAVAVAGTGVWLAAQPGGSYPTPPELKPVPGFHIEIADTQSRVMIANVYLTVGDLVLSTEGETPKLVGTYSIEVPLRSAKNESGSMVLPLGKSLVEYMEEGGELMGQGTSFKLPDAKREIVCEIKPDPGTEREGQILLRIDTGDRVLEFSSTYVMVGDLDQASARTKLGGRLPTATVGTSTPNCCAL